MTDTRRGQPEDDTGSLGLPEILLLLALASVFWVLPVVTVVWSVVTLRRLRLGQDDLKRRLDAVERPLQKPCGG